MKRTFFIFLLFFLCSIQLLADQYFQKLAKYTTEHGIVNNTILSIFQDTTGLLWIGTLEGLNSYNGQEFTNYLMSDSISGYTISFIDQVSKNQLLLGTNKGNFIFSISDRSYTKLYLPENNHSTITTLFQIQNHIFIGSESGIFEYNKLTKIGVKVSNESISCKQISSEGKILLGTNKNGIREVSFDNGVLILSNNLTNIKNEKVLSIQYLSNGVPIYLTEKGIWISGKEEIRKDASNLFSSLSISQNDVSNFFSSLTISLNDEIIVGTSNEFVQQVYYSNNKYSLKEYINRDNETFNDYYDSQVNVLYCDISGSVWVGTNRAGLNRIDRKKITYRKFKATNQENESEAGYINALNQSRDGKIWIGTSGKGLYMLNEKEEELKSAPILQGNMNDLFIEAILHFKDKLYIGTRHMGIITASYPPKKSNKIVASGQLFSSEAGLSKNDYIYGLKQFNDKLYICSNKGSFVCRGESSDLSQIDSIPSIDINVDSLNNTWILSGDFQLYYNQHKFDFGSEVFDLFINSPTEIWVATSKGLALIQTDNPKPVFFNPPNKVIEFTSIGKDKEGQYWLGSRMGMYRFDPKLKLFASYQIPGGAKANSFNHSKLLRTHSGTFYFGSNDGVISISPETNSYLSEPLFDVEQDKVTNCIFTIWNYSFNNQEDNGIAYCFSHPDSTWCYLPSDQNILDFSYLSKGKYQIDITAINSDGIINDKVKHFEFKIKRSFNLSALLWFVVCIVLGTYLFFNFKKRRNAHGLVVEENENLESPEERILREWMSDEFMNKAISLIENKVSDTSYNVNELYDGMQMSKSNFYRKLKTKTDLSPNELIRFIRLVGSTKLLIEAKYSVNEIAYNRGFNSPSYFTRCFKQQYGIAPSEYKKYYENFIKNPE